MSTNWLDYDSYANQPSPQDYPWEYNPTSDYRRIFTRGPQFMGGDAGFDNGINTQYAQLANQYYGGAGSPHTYYFEKKDANGNWVAVNPGEHSEAASYYWTGVNSPEYQQAYQAKLAGSTLSPLEQSRLGTPEAIGQAIARPDLSQFSPMGGDQGLRELAFLYGPAAYGGTNYLDQYGLTTTPEQQQQILSQIQSSTPAAQAARDDDGGFLGGMLPLLLVAALATGPMGMGLWGAGEATAGDLIAGALADGGAASWVADAGLGALNAFDTGAMAGAAGYTTPGLGDTLLANLGTQFTPEKLATRALTNVGSNLIQGRDINLESLGKNLITGGLAGTVGSTINSYLPDSNPNWYTRALSGAGAGATGAALNGGDILSGAVSGGVGAGINSFTSDNLTPAFKDYLTSLGLDPSLSQDFSNFLGNQFSGYLTNSALGTISGSGTQSGIGYNQPNYNLFGNNDTSIPDFVSGIQSGYNWQDFLNFSGAGSKNDVDPYYVEAEAYDPNGAPKKNIRVADNQAAPTLDVFAGIADDNKPQADIPYLV